MTRQILLAQSSADELAMIAWLSARAQWLCLPRSFTDPRREPLPLGAPAPGGGAELVVFLKRAREAVTADIRPLLGDPRSFQVLPREGLCFEWARSRPLGASGLLAGHLRYLSRDPAMPARERALTPHVTALLTWVRKSYPLISVEKYPAYIGPDLAARIGAGTATLCWRSGNPKEVARNPKAAAVSSAADGQAS